MLTRFSKVYIIQYFLDVNRLMFITVEFFLLQAVVDFDIHFGHYSNYTSKEV